MPELKLKYPNAEVVIFEQSELPQIIKFIETLEWMNSKFQEMIFPF